MGERAEPVSRPWPSARTMRQSIGENLRCWTATWADARLPYHVTIFRSARRVAQLGAMLSQRYVGLPVLGDPIATRRLQP